MSNASTEIMYSIETLCFKSITGQSSSVYMYLNYTFCSCLYQITDFRTCMVNNVYQRYWIWRWIDSANNHGKKIFLLFKSFIHGLVDMALIFIVVLDYNFLYNYWFVTWWTLWRFPVLLERVVIFCPKVTKSFLLLLGKTCPIAVTITTCLPVPCIVLLEDLFSSQVTNLIISFVRFFCLEGPMMTFCGEGCNYENIWNFYLNCRKLFKEINKLRSSNILSLLWCVQAPNYLIRENCKCWLLKVSLIYFCQGQNEVMVREKWPFRSFSQERLLLTY